MEKKFIILYAISVFVWLACRQQSMRQAASPLQSLRIGMTYTEVLQTVGFPDTIIHVGTSLDEYGSQTKIDEWWYGPHELVVLVNDTVNAIDLDAQASQQRIRHIMDSARRAEERLRNPR
ncbi:MAG: hypothetical protein NZL95_08940 [Chitinophagales bacterium]|nr:hypothetical protein [Chitinophagales bacterium]MDW8428662.1 hypothetical protein [Chitinophagales bacterium]